MSLIQKIQDWSDKKKKIFSIITAIFLTLIIAGLWYQFHGSQNKSDASVSNSFSSFNKMFEDIGNGFNAATNQFGSTTDLIRSQFASSTIFDATTSTSTYASTSKN